MQNGFNQMEKELQLRANFTGNPLKNRGIASPYNFKKICNFQLEGNLVTKIAFYL